jgi:hypothetical protein
MIGAKIYLTVILIVMIFWGYFLINYDNVCYSDSKQNLYYKLTIILGNVLCGLLCILGLMGIWILND